MKRALRPLVAFLALVGAACHYERPIHPYRLEGWPGAPIEGDLFPLRDGQTWVFRDRLDPEGAELRLELARVGDRWILKGRAGGELELRVVEGHLEILRDGRPVERPLRLSGRVGDAWKAISGRALAFGYDRVVVLGEPRRALVVAIDRNDRRDLMWFVDGMGWVRFRTERLGSAVRDARLVEYRPGAPS